MDKTDKYLQDNFGVELLTDEQIDYESVQNEQWGVDEGPNAKNTVIAMKAICEGIIPEEYPIEISGKRCRGGVFDGEKQLTPSECRTQYKVHDIKKAKKRCRKQIKNKNGGEKSRNFKNN